MSVSSNVAIKPEAKNSYDEVPYISYPYRQSHPAHLRTLGLLFGMNPPALETARVLELGCAAGGNLIPIAANYPKAHFVGVDLSDVQVNDGKNLINKVGLKNIELKSMSIMDINKDFGTFDYIIAHGVFSWVPEFVQEKMIEICGNNLSDNGVAYISYNTLPGWNVVKTIRDMMLFHTSGFQAPNDKVAQARLLLNFVKECTEGSDSAYSKIIKNEADILTKQPDHYILHDHMEENNHPIYFHKFIEKCVKNNLQYLGDATVSSMYVGNLPEKASAKLAEIKDIVQTEQYMDFINNRRFRSTLLCKNNVPLNRALKNEDITKFKLKMNVFLENPLNTEDLSNMENKIFYLNREKTQSISTASPNLKAALHVLSTNMNYPLLLSEIGEKAEKLVAGTKADNIEKEFLTNAMKLLLVGALEISSEENLYKSSLADKPKLSKYAYVQIVENKQKWVTNQRHLLIQLSDIDFLIAKYMDGKNTIKQIEEKVIEHIAKGEISVNKDNKKVTDEALIKEEVKSNVQKSLESYLQSSLLV